MRRWLTLALCGSLFQLSACSEKIAEPSVPLDVRVSVDRNAIAVGDTLQVTVTATNRGAETLYMQSSNLYSCILPFRVVDAENRAVELPARFCLAVAQPWKELAPGESVVMPAVWTTETQNAAGYTTPVSPGVYRIVGYVYGAGWQIQGEARDVIVRARAAQR